MTLTMTCEIVFEKTERRNAITLHQVSGIYISSTFKRLTDAAEIVLPRNLNYFNKHQVKDVFRRGDAVTIKFGYDGKNEIEFSGYITQVSADIPITIKCEDEMWKLKQMPVNFSSPSISLPELLTAIAPGYEIDALNVELGGVRFSNTKVSEVLEKLQEDWGLYSYVQNGTLVSGKYYERHSDESPVLFHLERNCVNNSLQYKRPEDVIITITAVSTLANGQKIEVQNIGDKHGDERTLVFYNIKEKAVLRQKAEAEYGKLKEGGFDGSFTGFGIPRVEFGMKAKLISDLYGDRNGVYGIEAVYKTFNKEGIRQKINLGKAL